MTASNRDICIARVLAHEGGYSNNPSDPGGPTNFGITLADARAYWKAKATAADVRAMPKKVAVAIYEAKYWDALRCDELPSGVDYAVFDYGVNSGVRRAKKVLQRIVGVTDDGDLGPLTMQAVAAYDAAGVVAGINDERLVFLKSLNTWPVFSKGWSSRVADVRRDSLALVGNAMLQGEISPRATPATDTVGKGAIGKGVVIGKGVLPQPHALRAAVKGGGAGAAVAGAAASHAAIAAHPWSAAALAAGLLVVVFALIWIIARRHAGKQDAPLSVPAVAQSSSAASRIAAMPPPSNA